MTPTKTYRPNLAVLESKDPVLLHAELLGAFECISFLMAKVEELETRLNQNSHNSHRPPSSDGLKKKLNLPLTEVRTKKWADSMDTPFILSKRGIIPTLLLLIIRINAPAVVANLAKTKVF